MTRDPFREWDRCRVLAMDWHLRGVPGLAAYYRERARILRVQLDDERGRA